MHFHSRFPPDSEAHADIEVSQDAGHGRADLSTGDAAQLLGVHPSTVKRWFGTGRASVSATAGGHRRIPLEAALRAASERGRTTYLHGFGREAERVWRSVGRLRDGRAEPAQELLVDWLAGGRPHLIGRFLRHVAGAAAEAELPAVLDSVMGGFMRRVGEGWARGALRIRDERAASREVAETAYALLASAAAGADHAAGAHHAAEADPADAARPTAVVATVEPDRHVLGSLLVRLVLERRGWRVEHLGGGVPVGEIAAAQRASGAALVCASFTPPSGRAAARRLVEAARPLVRPCSPYALVVGGGGVRGMELPPDPAPFLELREFGGLADFCAWLDGPSRVRLPSRV